ncbi:ATP-dependent helicase [Saccharothrix syringae]|uniref:ATP-dependent helicase n=2 Tax=Saccharothrix syringae TaxID=103733 RepID=A0A5Q0HEY8_SACSY|nr:ATP-dependent helicase [Saccharothrix syringae]
MDIDATRRGILDNDGHLLIEGGPGSGKTTIALLKAAQVLEALQPEQHVLFLSFSRAAVRQIADRVTEHIAYSVRDHLEVRTFHAFFLDFVRAHGSLLTGRPSAFLPPDEERRRKADHDGDWSVEVLVLAQQGVYVFDQLAATAATLFERSTALRHLYSDRYPLIIVDEFQDTNIDQWRAIKALAEQSAIICLADPDQRIYEGFVKGVDDARLQQAVDVLSPTRFSLGVDNHRSKGNGILAYADAVLRNQPAEVPDAIDYLSYRPGYKPEHVAHWAIHFLHDKLTAQLGHRPTIAVLGTSGLFVARISEAISTDRVLAGKTLPAIDHELVWDPGLAAAAGYVVASILEWPALPRTEAVTATLHAIADFYRIKTADKETQSARQAIATTVRAIEALTTGRRPASKTAKAMIQAYDEEIQLTGNPVTDWQLARARLQGSPQLAEIFGKARLLRLLHASDSLAWGLRDAWNGEGAYPGAADVVRSILAEELVTGPAVEPHPVTLMNLHKSKGKEFDGVVIVDELHNAKLLDTSWPASRIIRQRRVIRVAITRARHRVMFVRPKDAAPLVHG